MRAIEKEKKNPNSNEFLFIFTHENIINDIIFFVLNKYPLNSPTRLQAHKFD